MKKSREKVWWLHKKCVPLHPQIRNEVLRGSLAQLNRASDYGSEGCGFESRGSHKIREAKTKVHFQFWLLLFCVAQPVAGVGMDEVNPAGVTKKGISIEIPFLFAIT